LRDRKDASQEGEGPSELFMDGVEEYPVRVKRCPVAGARHDP